MKNTDSIGNSDKRPDLEYLTFSYSMIDEINTLDDSLNFNSVGNYLEMRKKFQNILETSEGVQVFSRDGNNVVYKIVGNKGIRAYNTFQANCKVAVALEDLPISIDISDRSSNYIEMSESFKYEAEPELKFKNKIPVKVTCGNTWKPLYFQFLKK